MKTPATSAVTIFAAFLVLALAIAPQPASAESTKTFSQQELDQMLAPIALHPDPLLSQMLMASTYPLEVVHAARWSRANPHLRGEDAVRAVADKDWEQSVKALVAFPEVLVQMDEKIEWTEALGDAFLAQPEQVMETVQALRQRAAAAGNLKSDDRIRVHEDGQALAIKPADARVIYVPYYDPWTVYGPWWWPASPPVYWAPSPGYAVRPGYAVYYGWGVNVVPGFFFASFDWPRRCITIVQIQTVRPVVVNRPVHPHPIHAGAPHHPPQVWRHDPVHRKKVGIRHHPIQQPFARPATPEPPIIRPSPTLEIPSVSASRQHPGDIGKRRGPEVQRSSVGGSSHRPPRAPFTRSVQAAEPPSVGGARAHPGEIGRSRGGSAPRMMLR